MTDLVSVVEALWRPFVPAISEGGPVFFTYSTESLSETFRAAGVECGPDPVTFVNLEARRLFDVVDGEAVLRAVATRPLANGFSPAIILVCQQVLAVEEMVREPSGYSENAYFPRLRRMMSPDLELRSLNPFSFQDFEAIWRTLAMEVRAVPGATSSSVTFRFGVEVGVNKARSFPLSQGLLSLEDLRVITTSLGQKRISKMSASEIWRGLRRCRSKLSRRGQRLIALGIFKDRVIDQVLGFANRAVVPVPQRADVQRTNARPDIAIFKESIDWLSMEYRAFLVDTDTGARNYDSGEVFGELDKRCTGEEALLFAIGELGDLWRCSSKATVIEPGSLFLAVGNKREIASIVNRLRTLGLLVSGVPGDLFPLGKGSRYFIGELVADLNQSREVHVKDGRIIGSTDRDVGYSWIGGVSTDARGRRFLREALPRRIRFKSMEFGTGEAEAINGHRIDFEAFVSSLGAFSEDVEVDLTFPGSNRARLGVAIQRGGSTDRVGYLVYEDGTISPQADRVSSIDFAIVGCEEVARASVGFASRDCMRLMQGLLKDEGEMLSQEVRQHLLARVEASRIPKETIGVLTRLLSGDCKIPDALRKELGMGLI